jgi:hypothetical protein
MRLTNSDKITIRSLVEHSWRDANGNYWHIDRMAARRPAIFLRLIMRLQDLGYMHDARFMHDELPNVEGVTMFAFTKKGQAWVDAHVNTEPSTAATLVEFVETYKDVMGSRAAQIHAHVLAFLQTGNKGGMELVENLRKVHGMKIPNINEVRDIVDDMATAGEIGVHHTPGGQFIYESK